jgi:hypothetical protein
MFTEPLKMTSLTINLPENLAQQANAAGLLNPQAIEVMLREKLRNHNIDALLTASNQLAAANFPPMTLDEIQKEVNIVRAQRQKSAPRT